jgi:hypothetical protein
LLRPNLPGRASREQVRATIKLIGPGSLLVIVLAAPCSLTPGT